MRKGVPCILAPAAALAIALILPDAGCQELPPVELCGEIPEGGCPIGRGGSCDDEVCAALYDCVHGDWTEVKRCSRPPVADGGGDDAGDADTMPDACTPVLIDHGGEATGCKPDLQNPDCPAVAAEPCAETACLTGCIDFYLCMQGNPKTWVPVAYCAEDGGFMIMP